MQWKVRTKIWLWSGNAAWHFVTVPKRIATGIKAMSEGMRSPTGSVRVVVTIKNVTWKTSLFPTKEGNYLLPIKAEVRKKAKIAVDDTVGLAIVLDG
ncbi:MAG: DUF1905 domain-containing protein [Rhodospirillaceae bacterium]